MPLARDVTDRFVNCPLPHPATRCQPAPKAYRFLDVDLAE